MKKITTYEEFKNLSESELLEIDPDDYTDEENIQRSFWYKRLEQELAFNKFGKLTDLQDEDIWWLGLNNKYILNKVISELPEEFIIDGKTIKGREIITRDDYFIIKEDGKNNFYRIEK